MADRALKPRDVRCAAYQVKLGTADQTDADTEWVLKPFMRTAKKRKYL
jgi:hypothetical protein